MSLPTTYSDPIRIAVIGGTGLSTLPGFSPVATLTVQTPWGAPSSPISVLHHKPSPNPTAPPEEATSTKPTPIAFLSRHGTNHSYAPHEIPSRANIAALRSLGVRSIIAFSAVGSLQEEIRPRDFVVPDQVIDRTKGIRPFTFFEGGMVGHVPFADPFDGGLRDVVCRVGKGGEKGEVQGVLGDEGGKVHEKGLLICMEGPQFSTRAESNLYRSWGGSVINMSALPEAKLAREAEIAYCMICMSTDYDCWHSSGDDVSVEMVMGNMKANSENARSFLAKVLDELCKKENEEVVMAKSIEGSVRFAGAMTKPEGRSDEAVDKLDWLLPGYFK